MYSDSKNNLDLLRSKHADIRISDDDITDSPRRKDVFSTVDSELTPHKQSFREYWGSVRGRKIFQQRVLPAVLLSVVVLGGVATYLMAFTNFDIRQLAWGGVGFSRTALQRSSFGIGGDNVTLGDPAVAELFTDLTFSYPAADVVSVRSEEFDIDAVLFKHYDESVDSTFIYARVRNMPYIDGTIPKVWLESPDGLFLEAGVGQLNIENDELIGYFITITEGNPDEYQTLWLTLDAFLDQETPSPAFLKANFKDEDTEVDL